jgi:lysyl-tRNA synthetase class 2
VAGSWQHFTVREAFLQFAGWDPFSTHDPHRFDVDLVEKVEPHLGYPTPCILKDYPAHSAALARLKFNDPSVAERFELYWAGIELANGYSELTDSAEQRVRIEQTLLLRQQAGKALYPVPEAFLDSIDALPPCAGIALGIDRLIMLLGSATHIDEVIAFPSALNGCTY